MYCPSCGAGVATTARFCRQCGQPLQVPPAPSGPSVPTAPDARYHEVYRNRHVFGSRTGYIVGRTLRTLLIMALCAGVLWYGVHQIRTAAVGWNWQTAVLYLFMACAAVGIPGSVVWEREALRRFDATPACSQGAAPGRCGRTSPLAALPQ